MQYRDITNREFSLGLARSLSRAPGTVRIPGVIFAKDARAFFVRRSKTTIDSALLSARFTYTYHM